MDASLNERVVYRGPKTEVPCSGGGGRRVTSKFPQIRKVRLYWRDVVERRFTALCPIAGGKGEGVNGPPNRTKGLKRSRMAAGITGHRTRAFCGSIELTLGSAVRATLRCRFHQLAFAIPKGGVPDIGVRCGGLCPVQRGRDTSSSSKNAELAPSPSILGSCISP